MKLATMDCLNCGKPTAHLVDGTAHLLHFILSIFTGGAWLIFWIALSMRKRTVQCNECKESRQVGNNLAAFLAGITAFLFITPVGWMILAFFFSGFTDAKAIAEAEYLKKETAVIEQKLGVFGCIDNDYDVRDVTDDITGYILESGTKMQFTKSDKYSETTKAIHDFAYNQIQKGTSEDVIIQAVVDANDRCREFNN